MWLVILVLIVLVLVAGLVLGAIVTGSLNQLADRLPAYEEALLMRGAPLATWLMSIGVDASGLLASADFDPGAVVRFAVAALRALVATVSSAFLMLMILLFMLGESKGFSNRLGRVLPAESGFSASFRTFSLGVRRQMSLQTLGNLVVAAVFTIGLLLLGVDFALLWGTGTFFLAYIPNIGVPLSAIPPILMAYVQYGTGSALIVLALIIVLNLAWDNMIAPRVMGIGANLSPAVVFLSFIFWSWVLGITGAVLAVPLTSVLKLLMEASRPTRWMAVLLSAKAPPADRAAD